MTRYEDTAALLRDRQLGRQILHVLGRDELGWPPPNPLQHDFDFFQANHLLDREPPDHTRLRRLLGNAFTPQRVEGLRPTIARIVDGLLDTVAPLSAYPARRRAGRVQLWVRDPGAGRAASDVVGGVRVVLNV